MTVVSGLLIGASWFYPAMGPVGTLGWVTLIHESSRSPGLYQATSKGLASGAIALLIAFHWALFSIYETTYFGVIGSGIAFIVFIAWESIAFGIFAAAACLLTRSRPGWLWLLVPTWVCVESAWPRVFPWSIAHTYLEFGPLVQVAELAGSGGIAAWLMSLHVGLFYLADGFFGRDRASRHASTARKQQWATVMGVGVGLAGVLAWGNARSKVWSGPVSSSSSVTVAAVQVDPTLQGATQRMQVLSDSRQQTADLYVWPESALGIYDASLKDFTDEQTTVELSQAPNPAVDPYPNNRSFLLAGGKTYDRGGRDRGPYRNNAFLIDSQKRIVATTSKRVLMPVGEYLPMESWVPWLASLAALDTEIVRGTSYQPLVMSDTVKIGASICYEDTDPSIASELVRSGASILVGLINASAFDDPRTLRQHLQIAQLRAVENRRWFVRCSSTGITCAIDPAGRIRQQLPPKTDGVLVAHIAPLHELTFFTLHPKLFTSLMFLIVFFAGVFLLSRKH